MKIDEEAINIKEVKKNLPLYKENLNKATEAFGSKLNM